MAPNNDETRVVALLRCSHRHCILMSMIGSVCPIASCAGRPGAYLRWFRARSHLFLLDNNGSLVRLLDTTAPPPSAAVSARARQGLGGVAGCSFCGIPCFTDANQRGQHEAGSRHRATIAAARSALTSMGLASSLNAGGGAQAVPPPPHTALPFNSSLARRRQSPVRSRSLCLRQVRPFQHCSAWPTAAAASGC